MELPADATRQAAEPSIGDAFGWPMRDHEWVSKLLLMGLIGLIPIVGALQLTGWLLAALDNLRAGRQQLPPAGFRYASRGVWLFVAGLIYGAVLLVALYAGLGLMVVAMTAFSPQSTSSSGGGPAPIIVFPLMFAWLGTFGLASLALYLFVPLVILFTDRGGLKGAFNWIGFVRAIRQSPRETLAAGAVALVAYLISGIGSYLCYVGLLFTIPYSLAVLAGVLHWYEVKAKPGSLPERM